MSAPLKRKIAVLEAKLAAEIQAHQKTFGHYRDTLHELVDLQMRNKAALVALVALVGGDYFEGGDSAAAGGQT